LGANFRKTFKRFFEYKATLQGPSVYWLITVRLDTRLISSTCLCRRKTGVSQEGRLQASCFQSS
jgi:hypothetical protein